MLMAALLFSLTATIGKAALNYLPGLPFAALYSAVLAVVAGVGMRPQGPRLWQTATPRPWAMLGVSLAMAVMVWSHFVAIEHVTVAYMIAIKRTSLVFGLIYGLVWFREPAFGRNLLAALIMLAGLEKCQWHVRDISTV